MPVVFAVNFDVQDGIVNGMVGTVNTIYYYTDNEDRRHVTACVVNVPNSANTALPPLPMNQAVALQDTISMNFTHPYSKKHCVIKQTQIPLLPAFALTVHKAQAQTLPKAIIDIESVQGTESPYVMMSRVQSITDVLILRPFSFAKITMHQSQETQEEMTRLQQLHNETLKRSQPQPMPVMLPRATCGTCKHKTKPSMTGDDNTDNCAHLRKR